MSTPETITAVERAKALGIQKKSRAAQEVAAQIRANFREMEAARIRGSSFDFSKADKDMSFAVLPIGEIEPYKYNPRVGANPRYEEIKSSIRADGITNMLTVTRKDKLSKYTTYGGGNTRLMIAKELHEEGDERFALLHVVVKEWPGDAQIITAQLAENENRGDISFWEKALGVQRFREELEKETGKKLSSNALHDELRKRGLNYGVKTVQNFSFSVENLAPIGRWLASRAVNEVIRPAYSSLLNLAEKLGKSGQARGTFNEVMQQHSKRMESAEQPAELDVQALIDDWKAAFAALLDTSVEQLQAMQDALKANSGMSAQALREVPVSLPVEATGGDDGHDEPVLPRSTAPSSLCPSFKVTTREDDVENDEIMPPEPASAREAQPNLNGLITDIPQKQPAPPVSEVEKLLAEIKDFLRRIALIAVLQDVIVESKSMPFGFIIDFPEGGDWSKKVGEMEVQRPELRAALWRFLAGVSGQLDKRVPLPSSADVGDGALTFSAELVADETAFRDACKQRDIAVDPAALPYMSVADVPVIFSDPDLARLVIGLLNAIEKLRTADPKRAPDFFEWRF